MRQNAKVTYPSDEEGMTIGVSQYVVHVALTNVYEVAHAEGMIANGEVQGELVTQ